MQIKPTKIEVPEPQRARMKAPIQKSTEEKNLVQLFSAEEYPKHNPLVNQIMFLGDSDKMCPDIDSMKIMVLRNCVDRDLWHSSVGHAKRQAIIKALSEYDQHIRDTDTECKNQ